MGGKVFALGVATGIRKIPGRVEHPQIRVFQM
jgi:hypothetical protein